MTCDEEEVDLIVMREMVADALNLPRNTPVKELTVQATCALFRAAATDFRVNANALMEIS